MHSVSCQTEAVPRVHDKRPQSAGSTGRVLSEMLRRSRRHGEVRDRGYTRTVPLKTSYFHANRVGLEVIVLFRAIPQRLAAAAAAAADPRPILQRICSQQDLPNTRKPKKHIPEDRAFFLSRVLQPWTRNPIRAYRVHLISLAVQYLESPLFCEGAGS